MTHVILVLSGVYPLVQSRLSSDGLNGFWKRSPISLRSSVSIIPVTSHLPPTSLNRAINHSRSIENSRPAVADRSLAAFRSKYSLPRTERSSASRRIRFDSLWRWYLAGFSDLPTAAYLSRLFLALYSGFFCRYAAPISRWHSLQLLCRLSLAAESMEKAASGFSILHLRHDLSPSVTLRPYAIAIA